MNSVPLQDRYRFEEGAWTPDAWEHVKRPDRKRMGAWVQRRAGIEHEGFDSHRTEGATGYLHHTSMLRKAPVAGPVRMAATLRYAGAAAPSIVLCRRLDKDRAGRRVYAEHYEAVLYRDGLNFWHMTVRGGEIHWRLLGFNRFRPHARRRLVLGVEIGDWCREEKVFGTMVTMSVNGAHTFGCLINRLRGPYRVGLTASEGPTAFYALDLLAPPETG